MTRLKITNINDRDKKLESFIQLGLSQLSQLSSSTFKSFTEETYSYN